MSDSLRRIQPILICFNEEANLERVLAALHWAPSVLVVDSGSSDRSLAICAAHPNVRVLTRPFDDFCRQWRFALGEAQAEWVLPMDADYVLTPAFVDELRTLDLDAPIDAYACDFDYVQDGQVLRGALYPRRLILARRQSLRVEQTGHTQRFLCAGPMPVLKTHVQHDDRKPVERWHCAQRRYARDEAAHLLATPWRQLRIQDVLRRTGLVAPALVLLLCLFGRGLAWQGKAGWRYSLMRVIAEWKILMEVWKQRFAAGDQAGRA